jgi:hypothetical protein
VIDATPAPSRTPGEIRRDRELWTTVRIPAGLKARIDALCRDWQERYEAGRTAAITPSDKTGAITPYALIDRAIGDMEGKRRRSARSRAK